MRRASSSAVVGQLDAAPRRAPAARAMPASRCVLLGRSNELRGAAGVGVADRAAIGRRWACGHERMASAAQAGARYDSRRPAPRQTLLRRVAPAHRVISMPSLPLPSADVLRLRAIRASSSSSSSRTRWRSRQSLGASDAGAEVSEGVGLSVSVRKGETENVERNRDKSIGVTVYVGQRRGNASTSDFSRAALEQTVRAAYDIARFTAEDPPPACPTRPTSPAATPPRATSTCSTLGDRRRGRRSSSRMRCEAAALDGRPAHHQLRRRRRLGAAVALLRRQHARLPRRLRELAPFARRSRRSRRCRGEAATTCSATPGTRSMRSRRRARRARGGRPLRRRARAVAPAVAQDQDLRGAGAVRVVARGRRCSARYVQATSGGALYRKSTLPARQPRQARAARAHRRPRGSARAARQGQRAVRRRRRGDAAGARSSTRGVVQGYFLSSYSARKLGMRTTGHAGGSHNLTLTSRLTRPGDDLDAMLREARPRPVRDRADGAGRQLRDRRLLARRGGLLGRERRASPFRCTRSRSPATCATMFEGIVAVGADAYTMGSKTIGSVLIERMKIAGA